ncbi:MAG: (Fe-S)-binding protein [Syntrophobacteraceae bacterium]
MLISNYTTEFVRLSCGSQSDAKDLVIYLDQDISEVIPYLNAVFEGFQYTKEPRSVSFRLNGKLVVVHPRKICVSAPGDRIEAQNISEWLREKINDTWERKDQIEPRYENRSSPKVLEILRFLPKTNCGLCGEKTCTVFASKAARGAKRAQDCTPLGAEQRTKLVKYLERFNFK